MLIKFDQTLGTIQKVCTLLWRREVTLKTCENVQGEGASKSMHKSIFF